MGDQNKYVFKLLESNIEHKIVIYYLINRNVLILIASRTYLVVPADCLYFS